LLVALQESRVYKRQVYLEFEITFSSSLVMMNDDDVKLNIVLVKQTRFGFGAKHDLKFMK